MWNEFSQFSIDSIPIINNHIIIHYIHEHLQVLIVDSCLQILLCGSWHLLILNVDSFNPVHMYSQGSLFAIKWDTFPSFESITIHTCYNGGYTYSN